MAAVIIAVILGVVLAVREAAARRRERALRQELESLRSQLEQRERFVNVGQLVSGLAQDLKSPLQGALGSAELLAASDPSDARTAQELVDIRDNVTRAVGIVRNLLAFTETSDLDRRWHDLNEIVRRALQRHRHGRDGHVSFHGTGRLQLVYVDGRQLERVVTSLLAHTAANVRGPGGVAVITRRVASPVDHLVIDIDDPAVSGADDDIAWSGDLEACRRVLQAHGGSLEVEHQPSGGLRFHMELPVTELVETQAS